MRRNAHIGWMTTACLLVLASMASAQAGGGALGYYEVATPDQGLSGAGAGARAQDAATAYTNPAGMGWLEFGEMLVGYQGRCTSHRLNLGPDTVSLPAGSTDGGGQAGVYHSGLGFYIVTPVTKDTHLGFSINEPYQWSSRYSEGWVGTTFVSETFLSVYNISPAVSWRVNEWLAVGAAWNIYYVTYQQEWVASPFLAVRQGVDRSTDLANGFTVGAMFQPTETTRIGVTYRSFAYVDFDDKADPGLTGVPKVNWTGEFEIPQSVNISLYQDLTDRLALLADVGWTDWSSFNETDATAGPLRTGGRGWNDTFRGAIGLQYLITDRWIVRGGYGYDSSPVGADERLPDFALADWHRFSVGLEHKLTDKIAVGAAYTFGLMGDSEVDSVAIPGGTGVVLDGDYDDNHSHFLNLTVRVVF